MIGAAMRESFTYDSGVTKGPPLVTITGSQKPYICDLPHLMSLPVGFEFRFRYRHRWVDNSILEATANDRHAYAGRQIIIIFHSQDSRRVIPIRVATILAVESVGPMIFVRFRVGPFFKVGLDIAKYSSSEPDSSVAAGEKLVRRATEILGIEDRPDVLDLSGPLPAGWYLRSSSSDVSDDELDSDSAVAAWARMVAILHCEPSLTGIPFFFLMGFRSEDGTVIEPHSIQNRFSPTREAINGFELRESTRYRMRVAEWCESPKEVEQRPVLINCEYDKTQFALEGSSNLVVGRYDVIEFTFSCLQSGYSEMALRAQPQHDWSGRVSSADRTPGCSGRAVPESPDAKQSEVSGEAVAPWDGWPAIFVARVPVIVKPKTVRTVLAALAMIVGLGLYLAVAPYVGPLFGEKWKSAAELAGLAALFFGYGRIVERLEKLFRLSGGMRRLGSGPAGWEKQDT